MAIKWLNIKSTQHNRDMLRIRGLFSDDAQLIFDLYTTLIQDETTFYIDSNNPCISELINILDKANIKY